ncbi:MAG: hypothetical protein ACTSRP_05285 [Candidatus Helarchaeota archaeon]
MNSEKFNDKDKYQLLNKELLEYIKFITSKTGISYENFIEDLKKSRMFQELEKLSEEYYESENKEKVKLKIMAFEFKLNYKFKNFKNLICSDEDYKLFIKDLENLIEKSLKKEKDITLRFLWKFLIEILKCLEKEKRFPSDLAASIMIKEDFKNWILERIRELKYLPLEQMRFLIFKDILYLNGEVWENFRKLKGRLLKDKNMRLLDAKNLVEIIKDHYESFRIINGLIIGLFDLIEGKFDDNFKRSYFGDKFNTDRGFYSSRKIQKNRRLKKDARPTLKRYIEKYNCQGFNDFFAWLMKEIKPIRLTAAHHQPFIEQEKIQENKYLIKYNEEIKEVDINFLKECNKFLSDIIKTIYYIVSYYFYSNI